MQQLWIINTKRCYRTFRHVMLLRPSLSQPIDRNKFQSYVIWTSTTSSFSAVYSLFEMYWVCFSTLLHICFLSFDEAINLFLFQLCVDASRDEYFQRNFAWHAITQYSGDLTCNCKNATIIFLKPTPDQLVKDRLGLMV